MSARAVMEYYEWEWGVVISTNALRCKNADVICRHTYQKNLFHVSILYYGAAQCRGLALAHLPYYMRVIPGHNKSKWKVRVCRQLCNTMSSNAEQR